MGLGRFFGLFWYHCLPIRCGVALENVSRTRVGRDLSPKKRKAIVRGACINLATAVLESLRWPLLTPAKMKDEMEDWLGMEHLEAALAKGKGAILVSMHLGPFEQLPGGLALAGFPVAVIYRAISMGSAQEYWSRERGRMGLVPIAPRRSREHIKECLDQGMVVVFAFDQHMAPYRGIACDFLGRLASTMTGAVRLALATGAPIVPGFIHRRSGEPHRHIIEMDPEYHLECPFETEAGNIRHNTQALNHILEKWVLEYPDQWLWHHRRFKVYDDLDAWEIPDDLKHLIE